MRVHKINSVNFGLRWIAGAVCVGAAFLVVFGAVMRQDFGKAPYCRKHLKETIPFDPERQYAVIRSSVCTGEKAAGFKSRTDGRFTEVMLIKNDADRAFFMKTYGVSKVDTEY